jgi:hypothetical protein
MGRQLHNTICETLGFVALLESRVALSDVESYCFICPVRAGQLVSGVVWVGAKLCIAAGPDKSTCT